MVRFARFQKQAECFSELRKLLAEEIRISSDDKQRLIADIAVRAIDLLVNPEH